MVLDGLLRALSDPVKYNVVLAATNGAAFLEGVRAIGSVDLAIVDLSMPGMDGFEVLRSLAATSPHTHALAFSFSEELAWVRRAMDAGACGYLLKGSDGREVRLAIDTVVSTGHFHSDLVLASLTGPGVPWESVDFGNIPAREFKYLQLVCDPRDLTYDQIADIMGVTRHAVDGYFRYFSKRFNLHSKGALIRFALKHRLVSMAPVTSAVPS